MQLGLVGWREQELLMADRAATTFGFKRSGAEQFADALAWQRQQSASRWLLIEGSMLPACVEKARARHGQCQPATMVAIACECD